mmetsp:Transcript_19469/g.45307  ORF Transcript_19469/g.45307 Transcript_19469/m.45307 type:complete len:209 (+) Transcript_19469:936-1562(+)
MCSVISFWRCALYFVPKTTLSLGTVLDLCGECFRGQLWRGAASAVLVEAAARKAPLATVQADQRPQPLEKAMTAALHLGTRLAPLARRARCNWSSSCLRAPVAARPSLPSVGPVLPLWCSRARPLEVCWQRQAGWPSGEMHCSLNSALSHFCPNCGRMMKLSAPERTEVFGRPWHQRCHTLAGRSWPGGQLLCRNWLPSVAACCRTHR